MTIPPIAASVSRPRGGYGPIILIAVVASLGSLLFGFDTAVIAGANDALEKVFRARRGQAGLHGGDRHDRHDRRRPSPSASRPTGSAGRRCCSSLAVCFLVSSLGCGLARDWWEFLASRFIGGLAIGGASMVTPMYIAEISPPRLRGRLVMVNQFNIVVGVLLCFHLELRDRSVFSASSTSLGDGCSACSPVPSAHVLLLDLHRSGKPAHLVRKGGRPTPGRCSNNSASDDVDGELAAIQASLADRPGHVQERLFCRAYLATRVLLAGTMAAFNQLTGINAMLYYAPTIFRIAGASRDDSSLLQSIAIGGTLLVFTIVAMFIIDRFGRRILLLIGSVGMAVVPVPGSPSPSPNGHAASMAGWFSGADRLHRLLRDVAGRGHVRVHLRSLPERRPRQGAIVRHVRPLVDGGRW